MNVKMSSIEVDAATARLLKRRAAKRGSSVADVIAELLKSEELPGGLEEMERNARGPWAPAVLAEDVRRYAAFKKKRMAIPLEDVEAWVRSWGTAREMPLPKPRKV